MEDWEEYSEDDWMFWKPHHNDSIHNDTRFYDEYWDDYFQGRGDNGGISLALSIVSSLSFVVACSSLLMNSLLLWALAPVSTSVLKAKRLIQNLSLANLLLAVIASCDPSFLYPLTSLGGVPAIPDNCSSTVHVLLSSICNFVQVICVMGLAADRVFATVRPLRYGTTGYGPILRVALVFLPWMVALFLWVVPLSIVWSQLSDEAEGRRGRRFKPNICDQLHSAFVIAEVAFDCILVIANLISFMVYVSVFGVMRFRDRTIKSMTSMAARTNLSLARTFFLTNVTTFILYLPAPAFSIITQYSVGASISREAWDITFRGLFLLYTTNTFLDPLILITRIRSIRENLPMVEKPVRKKRQGDQKLATVPAEGRRSKDIK